VSVLGQGTQGRGSWQHEGWRGVSARKQESTRARASERTRGRETAAHTQAHTHTWTHMYTHTCTCTRMQTHTHVYIYRKTYCCKFARADACEPRIMLLKMEDVGKRESKSIVNLCEYLCSCGSYRYRYKNVPAHLYVNTQLYVDETFICRNRHTCRDRHKTV